MGIKAKLQNVRLSFPVLFKPEPFQGEGEEAYSCNLLIEESSSPKALAALYDDTSGEQIHGWGPAVEVLKKGIEMVAKETWKDKWAENLKALSLQHKVFLRSGDLKPNWDGYPGNMFVSARAKVGQRPRVVDRNANPLVEADGKIYAGCYVNGSIALWHQKTHGQRINAQILGVQFVRDGDSFGGGARPSEDEFEPIGTDEEAGTESVGGGSDDWM